MYDKNIGSGQGFEILVASFADFDEVMGTGGLTPSSYTVAYFLLWFSLFLCCYSFWLQLLFSESSSPKRNPFAYTELDSDPFAATESPASNIDKNGQLTGFTDKVCVCVLIKYITS